MNEPKRHKVSLLKSETAFVIVTRGFIESGMDIVTPPNNELRAQIVTLCMNESKDVIVTILLNETGKGISITVPN